MPPILRPPGEPWTVNAVLFILAGLTFLWLGASRGWLLMELSALWSVALGLGLWLKHGWTRLGATITLLALGGFGIYSWIHLGFKWYRPVGVITCIWSAWQVWRELAPPESDEKSDNGPMVSLVLLLSRPRYLEAPIVAELLKSAWQIDFHPGNDEADDGKEGPFVVGNSPLFMASTGSEMFVIHNNPVHYFNDIKSLLDKIPDLRLRKVVADHQAWLSVDCMMSHDGNKETQYPRIARAIAELADDTVLGLYQPATQLLLAWDAELETRLRDGTDLHGLFQSNKPPVVQVANDDPRMKAAVAEAKQRWPEFVAAFKERRPEGHYAVKAPITREGETEFIWIEVIGLEPEYIHGKLANDPVALGDLKLGDQVEVPLADLNDWVYLHSPDDEPTGIFTVKVVTAAWNERTKPSDQKE